MANENLDQFELKSMRRMKNEKRHMIRDCVVGNGYAVKIIGQGSDFEYYCEKTVKWSFTDYDSKLPYDDDNRLGLGNYNLPQSLGKKKRWEMADDISTIPIERHDGFHNRTASSYRISCDRTFGLTLFFIYYNVNNLIKHNKHYRINEYHTMDNSGSSMIEDDEDTMITSCFSERGMRLVPSTSQTELSEENISRTRKNKHKTTNQERKPPLHELHVIVDFSSAKSHHNRTRKPRGSQRYGQNFKFDNYLAWRLYSWLEYDDNRKTWYSPLDDMREDEEKNQNHKETSCNQNIPSQRLLSEFIDSAKPMK